MIFTPFKDLIIIRLVIMKNYYTLILYNRKNIFLICILMVSLTIIFNYSVSYLEIKLLLNNFHLEVLLYLSFFMTSYRF